MKGRAHPVKGLILAIVGLLPLSFSCKGVEPPAKLKGNDSQAANTDDIKRVDNRPSVSAFELDESGFRLNDLRVGLQDFLSSQSPAVVFTLPKQADYIEVMRCRHDTIIRGIFDNLQDVDLGAPSTAAETRVLQANDFWKAASENNGCLLIASNLSSPIFIDGFALTGSYRYVARACVAPGRLKDKELLTNRNCSKQVALSPALTGFVNKRIEKENQALAESQKLRDKADGLGRQIYYLTVDFNNALVECQNIELDRQALVKRKQALSTIIGTGISLAANVFLPESGLSAVNAGTKTWPELWKETWDKRDTIAGEGVQIGQALNLLFSSPADFPRTCTNASRIQRESVTATQELKQTHELFASAMEAADRARKVRLAGER